MNPPVRRLSVVMIVMFLALMASASWVQYGQASALNDDPRNTRTIYREYGRERGPIVVGGEAIAASEPSDDAYGYLRTYSDGPLYSPLTGYFPVILASTGIEHYTNGVLNGSDTSLLLSRIRQLFTGGQQRGGTVELTIDEAAQQAAWDGLGNQRGAVVAMDPSTGAVLAMVSKPAFDPNTLATHDTGAARSAYSDLVDDPDDPLANRAIAGGQYPPGSTFKLIDLAALLESGQYTPDSEVDAPTALDLPGTDRQIHNPGGAACGSGGRATLTYALQVSCNTPFANLAMELGEDALREQAEAFGFDQDLSVPMPVTPSRLGDPENDAQLAMTAIGQLDVRVTPMQMAMVASAVANGGELMTPYTVATERGPDLQTTFTAKPSTFSEPISAQTAEQMTEMMVNVAENGTGSTAQIPGVDVAAKTGTAQSGRVDEETGEAVPPSAWFTAFAPAGDPQVAVAVVVEEGGDLGNEATGSHVAGPIARSVIEAVLGS